MAYQHIFVPDCQDSWHKELNEAQDRALESWVDLAWLGQEYRLKKHVRHVDVSVFMLQWKTNKVARWSLHFVKHFYQMA